MHVGCTTIIGTVNAATLRHGTEFNSDRQTYNHTATISLDGIMTKCSPDITLQGYTAHFHKLPLGLLLRIGEPEVFEDPASQQTLPRDGGLIMDVLPSRLGYFVFMAAYKDRDQRLDEPDALFAELNLTEGLFSDIWHWCRNGCQGEAKILIEVFGPHLKKSEGYHDGYDWIVSESSLEYTGLHVVEFNFTVVHKSSTASEQMA